MTGKQYRLWMFSSADESAQQGVYLLHRLPWDLGWLGLAAVAAGAVILVRGHRAAGILALLLTIASVAFACGYVIQDVDSYLLACLLGLGLAVAAGLMALGERFGLRACIGAGVALVAVNVGLHWSSCDASHARAAEVYAGDVLESLPRDAVLLSGQWDQLLSPSYYLQEVEGLRRDAVVVSPFLLHYSWYLDELRRRAPGLVQALGDDLSRYERLAERLENGRPCDPTDAEKAYARLVNRLFEATSASGRPVCVTGDVALPLPAGVTIVPQGLVLAVRRDTTYVPEPFPRYRGRPEPGPVDSYVATVLWSYGLSLANRARYEQRHGHPDLARLYIRRALDFDPGWRRERLPTQAAGGRELTVASLEFFERLRDLQASIAPTPSSPWGMTRPR